MAHILLIDDDQNLREVVAIALMGGGHTVAQAVDGRQALAFFLAEPFDLVITDVVMPNRDGFETIAALRRESLDTPIIMMSGGARYSTLYLDMGLKLGARRVLAKPFTSAVLLQAVDEVLAPPLNPPTDAP